MLSSVLMGRPMPQEAEFHEIGEKKSSFSETACTEGSDFLAYSWSRSATVRCH